MTLTQMFFFKTIFKSHKLIWFGKKRIENLKYSLKLTVIEGE